MMFFRKKEVWVEHRERQILTAKQQLHKKINCDLRKQKELIDILENGKTSQILQALRSNK